MGDIMKRNDIPSSKSLTKHGVAAVGYTAAGVFLILLGAISSIPIVGIIAGGVVTVFGLTSLTSKDPADKRAGLIITSAGILTILSKIPIPVIQPFSKVLLGISAFGLIALGVINAVKFFRGLKKRS